MLPGTAPQTGQARRAVTRRYLRLPIRRKAIPVSISIGAITIEQWDQSLPIEPFLKEVDIALYRAKAAGRDRVDFAETLVTL